MNDRDRTIRDFDLKGYLTETGVSYWTHGKNVGRGWLGITCIYCDDQHNHLGINLRHKNFHCWKCLSTGNIIDLIMDLESTTYAKALRKVEDFQLLVPLADNDEEHTVARRAHGDPVLPLECTRGLRQLQAEYLRDRGFDPDVLADEWGLYSAPPYGPWKYRIIIPIRVPSGYSGPVTWTSLDVTGKQEPKYKAAQDADSMVPIGHILYGAHKVRKGGPVVVVEGPTDVWRVGAGAVATLGMVATPQRLRQLVLLGASRYFILYDGEDQAIQNAHKLGFELNSLGLPVDVLELSKGDPGELPPTRVQELRTMVGL